MEPAWTTSKARRSRCLWKHQTEPESWIYHAMLVVGYDDDLRAFEVMNSFGSQFRRWRLLVDFLRPHVGPWTG